MEILTKAAPANRSTERVLEALATLAAFLDRTINEVKSLDSEFQARMLQAVHDTEASLQSQAALHLETALAEMRTRLEEQFKAQVAELTSQWESEQDRLNKELERNAQRAVDWESERVRLNAEIERLTQSEAQALAAAQAANEKAASAPPPEVRLESASFLPEIARVEALIKEISVIIENPATDLSTVIRKNVERSELEAYLKGIRYVADHK